LLLLAAASASGQSVTVQASGGPTIVDSGHSVAAGIGVSPNSRFTMLFSVEQTHLSSRVTTDGLGRVSSAFRGGTFTLAAAEFRATILGRDRVSPYAFGGIAGGVSRPNVTELFPSRVTNYAQVLFVGGGLQVPLRERLTVFADYRLAFGAEGREGVAVFSPIRAGVAWRF
jgi:hypothetical protein